jgi:hypothetical protein
MMGGVDQNFMQSLMQQMGKYRTGISQAGPIGSSPDLVGMAGEQMGQPSFNMPVGGSAAVNGNLPPSGGQPSYPAFSGMQGGQGKGGMNMQAMMPFIQMLMQQGQGKQAPMMPPGPTQGLLPMGALAPRGYRGGL